MVTRYNKKSVTVVTEAGERWNVSPALLRKVDRAQSAENAEDETTDIQAYKPI